MENLFIVPYISVCLAHKKSRAITYVAPVTTAMNHLLKPLFITKLFSTMFQINIFYYIFFFFLSFIFLGPHLPKKTKRRMWKFPG